MYHSKSILEFLYVIFINKFEVGPTQYNKVEDSVCLHVERFVNRRSDFPAVYHVTFRFLEFRSGTTDEEGVSMDGEKTCGKAGVCENGGME